VRTARSAARSSVARMPVPMAGPAPFELPTTTSHARRIRIASASPPATTAAPTRPATAVGSRMPSASTLSLSSTRTLPGRRAARPSTVLVRIQDLQAPSAPSAATKAIVECARRCWRPCALRRPFVVSTMASIRVRRTDNGNKPSRSARWARRASTARAWRSRRGLHSESIREAVQGQSPQAVHPEGRA